MTETQLINEAIRAAILAGKAIKEVYASDDFEIVAKADQTPITRADKRAHHIILDELKASSLPVISEEGSHENYNQRKHWELFWLVDPLDGTKEFIKRTDEFTVNIALIRKNTPIGGVIYSPISGLLYVGIPELGAYKFTSPEPECTFQLLQEKGIQLPEYEKLQEYTVVVSRSHMSRETELFIEKLQMEHRTVTILQKGSSLKTCMVAEGSASCYPRFGKTMEWDTAAGHALVKSVGKQIVLTDLKTELTYNKESLVNPNFIVL